MTRSHALRSLVLAISSAMAACGPAGGFAGATDSTDTGTADGASTTAPAATTTTQTASTSVETTGSPPGTTSRPPLETDTGADDVSFVASDVVYVEDCDPWLQDCPRTEKCVPWADDGGDDWTGSICRPIVDDPGQPGDPCQVQSPTSGFDSCDLGSVCWGVDPETNEGTCYAQCSGRITAPYCNDPDTVCALWDSGVAALCLNTYCDPLLQDCPVANEGCYAWGDLVVCLPVDPAATHAAGEPCEQPDDCAPGTQCVAPELVPDCAGALGCCSPWCDIFLPDPDPRCLAGQQCTPFFEEGGWGPEYFICAAP